MFTVQYEIQIRGVLELMQIVARHELKTGLIPTNSRYSSEEMTSPVSPPPTSIELPHFNH